MAEKTIRSAASEDSSDVDTKKTDAGVGGGSEYSFSQYSAAGITWERNVWAKDRYFYKGQPISRREALIITDASRRAGRMLTDEEDQALGCSR